MSTRWLGLSLVSSLWILAPSFMVCQQTAKPVDPANVILARRLLRAMHYGENMLAGIESAFAERWPNGRGPAILHDSLVVRMRRSLPELLDSLAPGYASRFGSKELEEMIHFYESPAGQDLANQEASLVLQARPFGRRWMERITASVTKDLTDAGIDVNKQ